MPNEPRRIVLEKSKTVRRRYQRSNQRFRFTASQIERLDREQEREKKAKQLREKEKKRIAAKKRKAEQEARVRDERKRRGISDPNARVSSSQPLLSMFLGAGKVQPAPVAMEDSCDGNTDAGSAAGDTEVGSESDAFDDLAEDLEGNFSELDELDKLDELDAGIPEIVIKNPTPMPETKISTEHPTSEKKINASPEDDDEFSDCSAFDEDVLIPALPEPSSHPLQTVPTLPLESSFGGSFQYDPADFLEAEAAITKTTLPSEQPHSTSIPTLASSLGDSFRDETADWMEEAYANGNDFFDQLNIKIPPQ